MNARLPQDPQDATPGQASGLPGLPQLPPDQWARVGAGVALALVGTGLLSLKGLIRVAAVAGGGALAYQAWKSASGGGEGSAADNPAGSETVQSMAEAGDAPLSVDSGPASGLSPDASLADRPSLRDTLRDNVADDERAGLDEAPELPAVDLRGA